jgi:hypothetical protein
MKTNRKEIISGLRTKLKQDMKDKFSMRVERSIERYREEVLKVINMYNTFELQRFSGDAVKRMEKNYGNDPLIDTMKYMRGWKTRISYSSGNKVIGILYNNVYYAKWLEEGTTKMSPFRVGIIAYEQCKKDIDAILRGDK